MQVVRFDGKGHSLLVGTGFPVWAWRENEEEKKTREKKCAEVRKYETRSKKREKEEEGIRDKRKKVSKGNRHRSGNQEEILT